MGTPKGPWQARHSKLQQKREPHFKTMKPPVRAPGRDTRDTLSQKRGLRASEGDWGPEAFWADNLLHRHLLHRCVHLSKHLKSASPQVNDAIHIIFNKRKQAQHVTMQFLKGASTADRHCNKLKLTHQSSANQQNQTPLLSTTVRTMWGGWSPAGPPTPPTAQGRRQGRGEVGHGGQDSEHRPGGAAAWEAGRLILTRFLSALSVRSRHSYGAEFQELHCTTRDHYLPYRETPAHADGRRCLWRPEGGRRAPPRREMSPPQEPPRKKPPKCPSPGPPPQCPAPGAHAPADRRALEKYRRPGTTGAQRAGQSQWRPPRSAPTWPPSGTAPAASFTLISSGHLSLRDTPKTTQAVPGTIASLELPPDSTITPRGHWQAPDGPDLSTAMTTIHMKHQGLCPASSQDPISTALVITTALCWVLSPRLKADLKAANVPVKGRVGQLRGRSLRHKTWATSSRWPQPATEPKPLLQRSWLSVLCSVRRGKVPSEPSLAEKSAPHESESTEQSSPTELGCPRDQMLLSSSDPSPLSFLAEGSMSMQTPKQEETQNVS